MTVRLSRRDATRAWRLVALVAVALVGAWWAYRVTLHKNTDWSWFELGARSLVHKDGLPIYSDPRLRLYAENPGLQIGPPPLLMVAALEWLPINTIKLVFAVVMGLLGVVSITSVEATAAALRGTSGPRRWWVPSATAAAFVAVWGFEATAWGHLDDALALTLAVVAALGVARRSPWWVIGLLLGTSVATKPWAIVLTPLLLGLPRLSRAPTALVVIGVSAAWWLPFIVGAPDTVQALSHNDVLVQAGAVPSLLGLTGTAVQSWLRPTQFALGLVVGSYVAVRRPWTAAPLAALAVRVLTDPFSYTYYALGPLLFALLWDVTRPGARRAPMFTIATAAALLVVPLLDVGGWIEGSVRLLWVVAVLIAIAVGRPDLSTAANRIDARRTGTSAECRETSHG